MRIVTFNVNGIRARPHQLEALRDQYDPDVIGLQEIKVQDPDFPREMVESLGYQVNHYGQKGHYGVAFLSKKPALDIRMGLVSDDADSQRRLITGVFESDDGHQVTVMNGYFPQGESRDHPTKFPHKERFYAELLEMIDRDYSNTENLVVMGDLNVAPTDLDIGLKPENAKRWLKTGKCSFLPEEREWVQRLMDWGLTDAYRTIHPDAEGQMSWFDYRSRAFESNPRRGLRIDYLLVSEHMNQAVRDAGIAYDIRGMEKPSDHAPVWLDFDI